ncbi:hypothetical protein [Nocardiopsis chromatogenes]|uniref:hypothetical protein n=1 Tax=Nocardiopsis chromatogenes TaxID=280239 RepID=UPI000348F73E|nr:hypothetical protein [Nocardiopsis chromatogenes]
MRVPPIPRPTRAAAAAGGLAAVGVLLAGCSGADVGEGVGDLELPDLGAMVPSASPSEEAEAATALPASCAEAGAAEVVGGSVPQGAQLQEESGAIEGADGAERLGCVWSGEGASVAVVYALNADTADLTQVLQESGGGPEANWEVDVDVYGDTYHSEDADAVGGELEYLATAGDTTRYVLLTLPGDVRVAAAATGGGLEQEDLERIALEAGQRIIGD